MLGEGLAGEIHLRSGRRKVWAGLPLDDGAEGFLAPVSGREVELVEGEECAGDDGGEHEHGGDEAVEGDAGGLHGGELGRAGEGAEGDEDGDEDAERGDVVEDVGDEVEKVIADGDEGGAIADHVADELEKGEEDEEGGEGGEDERKGGGEAAHDVVVDEQGEADVEERAEALGKLGGESLFFAGGA